MTSLESRQSEEEQEESTTMLWLVKRLKNMEDSFRSTRKRVEVRCQELEDRERQVGDYKGKLDVLKAETEKRDIELRGLEKLIQERREEAVRGGGHLDSLKMLIQEHKEELEINEKRFKDVKRMIGLKERECEMVEKRRKEGLEKVIRVEKEIKEKTELKQKLSRVVEVKGKVFCLHRASMEECSRKLEEKGRELEELSKKIELKEKQFEPRVEEIHLIEKRVNECLNEIELKERYIQSIEKSIQESDRSLEERRKRLDSISNALDMREKEIQSVEKSIQEREKSLEELRKRLDSTSDALDMREKELYRKAKDPELKQYEPAPGSNVVSSLIKVGEPEYLLSKKAPSDSLDARNLRGCGNACFANLPCSLDTAKLVLDWMQTYLSQYWTKGDVGFEVTSIKTYISILVQLMRLSPHAGAQVKEGAMKLAVQWKANMRADTENFLEILGYLHFIAAFRLLDTLNADEIVKLLGMIFQHKEASELCQTFDFADKIPVFIQALVERKQLMGAVGLICTCKLIDKFPPGPLLKEYIEEEMKCSREAYRSTKLHNEKVRIVDDQITRLRSAINLIKYYNLDSKCTLSTKFEMQITQLQHVKGNWRLQLGNLQTMPKRGTKRGSDTLSSMFEPSLQPNKFHRTVVPAPRPPAL